MSRIKLMKLGDTRSNFICRRGGKKDRRIKRAKCAKNSSKKAVTGKKASDTHCKNPASLSPAKLLHIERQEFIKSDNGTYNPDLYYALACHHEKLVCSERQNISNLLAKKASELFTERFGLIAADIVISPSWVSDFLQICTRLRNSISKRKDDDIPSLGNCEIEKCVESSNPSSIRTPILTLGVEIASKPKPAEDIAQNAKEEETVNGYPTESLLNLFTCTPTAASTEYQFASEDGESPDLLELFSSSPSKSIPMNMDDVENSNSDSDSFSSDNDDELTDGERPATETVCSLSDAATDPGSQRIHPESSTCSPEIIYISSDSEAETIAEKLCTGITHRKNGLKKRANIPTRKWCFSSSSDFSVDGDQYERKRIKRTSNTKHGLNNNAPLPDNSESNSLPTIVTSSSKSPSASSTCSFSTDVPSSTDVLADNECLSDSEPLSTFVSRWKIESKGGARQTTQKNSLHEETSSVCTKTSSKAKYKLLPRHKPTSRKSRRYMFNDFALPELLTFSRNCFNVEREKTNMESIELSDDSYYDQLDSNSDSVCSKLFDAFQGALL